MTLVSIGRKILSDDLEWRTVDYRGFAIIYPTKRIFTTFPVQATVKVKWNNSELERLLKSKSGDVIDGNSPEDAVLNAKRYVDRLLESEKSPE
jgi:hypothetical protein